MRPRRWRSLRDELQEMELKDKMDKKMKELEQGRADREARIHEEVEKARAEMEEELDAQLKKSKEQLEEEREQRRKLASTVEDLGSQAEATEKHPQHTPSVLSGIQL